MDSIPPLPPTEEARSGQERDAPEYAAWVGIDWADAKHDICLLASGQSKVERRVIAQTPETLHDWFAELRQRFGGRLVAVCLEQTRGPIMQALVQCEFLVLYPVNPQALAKFRKTFCVSGAKSDLGDAAYLLELVHKHEAQLPVWRPADANTRALMAFVEARRKTVDRRTAITNELQALLKGYYPQALELCGEELHRPLSLDWLQRFPSLQAAQKAKKQNVEAFYRQHNCRKASVIESRLELLRTARPATDDIAVIEPAVLTVQMLVGQLRMLNEGLTQYEKAIATWFAKHPDADLFKSLPGAGVALAPRLLAAFGSDRKRFPTAQAIQSYTGIAPITQQSGKSKSVHRRWFCPNFLRQTFHEYAGHSIQFCGWAKAYYAQQRAKGKSHHTAVRALAYKWMRIIWRMWQDHTAYDDNIYLEALRVAGSPLTKLLPVIANNP
jgi:transposase